LERISDTFPFTLVRDVIINPKTDYVARIKSAGVTDKESFSREIGAKLRFPYWDNPNWDGFNDWMTDLSWIPNQRVILLHEGTPKISRQDLVIYLDIALSAVSILVRDGRTLLVAFPEQSRALNDALAGVKR